METETETVEAGAKISYRGNRPFELRLYVSLWERRVGKQTRS